MMMLVVMMRMKMMTMIGTVVLMRMCERLMRCEVRARGESERGHSYLWFGGACCHVIT